MWPFSWLWPFGGGGAKRSREWPRCRKAHLARFPRCTVCDTLERLEVHHILPYQHWPGLELIPTNLITLCERCHLFVGHRDRRGALEDWIRWVQWLHCP